MNEFLPGLREPGEQVDVSNFNPPRRKHVVVAKWWWRPICWITRRPTRRTMYR